MKLFVPAILLAMVSNIFAADGDWSEWKDGKRSRKSFKSIQVEHKNDSLPWTFVFTSKHSKEISRYKISQHRVVPELKDIMSCSQQYEFEMASDVDLEVGKIGTFRPGDRSKIIDCYINGQKQGLYSHCFLPQKKLFVATEITTDRGTVYLDCK